MQNAMTAIVAIAALFFSTMCALLLEEFIFGGLFHLLRPMRRQTARLSPPDDLFGNSEAK
jgi:hypothetical protein